MLVLVFGTRKRKFVFDPDNVRFPFATGRRKGLVQSVQLRPAHTNIKRANIDIKDIAAEVIQKSRETLAKIIIQN